jgi:DNA-binding protein YbaB
MPEYAHRDANRGLKARFAEIQQSYERVRDGLADLQQRMNALQVTAASANNLVKATVDARGQLVRLNLQPRVMRELGFMLFELGLLVAAAIATAGAASAAPRSPSSGATPAWCD